SGQDQHGLVPAVHAVAGSERVPEAVELVAAARRGHSKRLTMFWYFSMYQRFSLLYLGRLIGRDEVPSARQTQGQRTVISTSSFGRLSSSMRIFMRVSTRWSFVTLRGPPLYAATGKMPSTTGLSR